MKCDKPHSITIYNELIYVTPFNQFIEIFTMEGKLHLKTTIPTTSCYGICINHHFIFISYINWRNEIHCYSHSGKFLRKFEVSHPVGLTIYDNKIYIIESGDHQIQVFTFDGTFINKWGKNGKENGEFRDPCHLSIFNDFIYITDFAENRIQVFDLEGNFVTKYGKDGEFVVYMVLQ